MTEERLNDMDVLSIQSELTKELEFIVETGEGGA